jgi:hypothetical protein
MTVHGNTAMNRANVEALIAAAADGATPYSAAGALHGEVSPETVKTWLRRGRRERLRLETAYPDVDPDELDPADTRVLDDERRFWIFERRWRAAEAGAFAGIEHTIHEAATVGTLEVTTTYDREGNTTGRTERRKPDARLALELAKARMPDRYAAPTRLEVAGPGGAIAGLTDAQTQALAVFGQAIIEGLLAHATKAPATAARQRAAIPEVTEAALQAVLDLDTTPERTEP